MPIRYTSLLLALAFSVSLCPIHASAGSTNENSLIINNLSFTGSEIVVTFSPYPSIEKFNIFSTTNLSGNSFSENNSGKISGYEWNAPNPGEKSFYQIGATPLESNIVLGAIVLNRLAYGPTPDILSGVLSAPETFISNQLSPENITEKIDDDPEVIAFYEMLTNTTARLKHLRGWFGLRAVGASCQLFEILTQFFDNHFNTQGSKSYNYFLDYYSGENAYCEQLATDLEFRELMKWREILLNPTGTFHDLLKISAESPAMIIYLDTQSSTSNQPNENYARELMELFTMGVDNGYRQSDIEQVSRIWTGWTVDKVSSENINNPHSPTIDPASNGVWTFHFNPAAHDSGAVTIFSNRTVNTRFGPPFAGVTYQLDIPEYSGTNGIQAGYDIIEHLADLPFTEEFIIVKLCQLFVHDGFSIGYDFTNTNLSAEGRLVHDCMTAWETEVFGHKGNIRQVLNTIFASELFRGQSAVNQKIKTPFEYVVSAIRALRAEETNGIFTASTDGKDLRYPMEYMGMKLFSRADPDGWPEKGYKWIDTLTVCERIRYIQNLLMEPSDPLKDEDYKSWGDDNVTYPVKLIKLKLPESSWTNAAKVTDYFLFLLFPGEGKANLDIDRSTAINFLNSDDSGVPGSSPFENLNHTSNEYDSRVRGMTALLLSLPRFHEQ